MLKRISLALAVTILAGMGYFYIAYSGMTKAAINFSRDASVGS